MTNELEWRVELHAHTIHSHDSLVRLNDLQAICQERGIDKLAITDHNTAKAALEMAHMYPMWIIPGEEIMTTHGELLAWYIREEVPQGLSPQETINQLRNQGAVIGISHPFDRYRRGAWELQHLLEIVDLVDAIEVFNARAIHKGDNDKALGFAEKYGKLAICGSDAHIRCEYGQAVLRAKPFANSADGLRQAFLAGEREEMPSSPWVHLGSTYAKWIKRVIPFLRT